MKELIIKYKYLLANLFLYSFLITLAYFFSFISRFELRFFKTPEFAFLFVNTLPVLLLFRLTAYWYFGSFKMVLKYAGPNDLKNLVKANLFGTLLFSAFIFALVKETRYFPRSVLFMEFAYNLLLIAGLRYSMRFYSESFRSMRKKAAQDGIEHKNILIIGAGDAGAMILREMFNNPRLGYNPIGFLDDDRSKRKRTINGVSVLGNTRSLPNIVKQHNIDEVIIAIPSAEGRQMRRIVNTCKRTAVKFKTLPYIGDLFDGKVSLSQIRDVAIEDLLGREAVSLEMSLIARELENRIIMITGAAGSIGSELVRQVGRFSPAMIILFERSENDLYHIEYELRKRDWGKTRLVTVIGDIKDRDRVKECIETYKPTYIFHAAAYKHVPIMEANPTEAVKNNIIGSRVLVDLAVEYGIEKFVLISTDKAVCPTNVMGATKRVAELILQSRCASKECKTQFVAVRFGNVLGSNGSVIPLFKKQIASGGPVTVTHPSVTRYFMTISEAVQLVLQAGAMGKGGEIFLLDMGDPIRIKDLAENLVRLSGLVPGQDIEIAYTGLRPGEKLYEELLIDGEGVKKTMHEKIRVLESFNIDSAELERSLSAIEEACRNGRATEVRSILKSLVPEYREADIYGKVVSFSEQKLDMRAGVQANRNMLSS